jgi:hypothetical protein
MVQLAVLYDTHQQTDRAAELLVEAERRARDVGDPDVLARALCERADVDLAVQKRQDAERLLAEARSLLAGPRYRQRSRRPASRPRRTRWMRAGDSHGAIAQAQAAIDLLVAAARATIPCTARC